MKHILIFNFTFYFKCTYKSPLLKSSGVLLLTGEDN